MQILAHMATIAAAALIFSGAQAPPTPNHSQPATRPAVTKTAEKPTQKPVGTEKPRPVIVTVKPGDTLVGIATDNRTTWQRIYDKNTKIIDPNLIYPEEKLTIPEADEKLAPRQLPAKTTSTPSPAPTNISEPTSPDNSNHIETASYEQPSAPAAPTVPSGSAWDRLASCESSGHWAADTGNGFYGGLQFTLDSWHAVGGSGLPSSASRTEQIMRAEKLQAIQGWSAWPACSVKVGLR